MLGSPAFYEDYYNDAPNADPQPVRVRLGGNKNLLEIPNMLFNNFAKDIMGKNLHVDVVEIE